MLKKFWCWLWGHRTLQKAYTGETFVAVSMLGQEHTVSLYRWQRFDFCLCCGNDVKQGGK